MPIRNLPLLVLIVASTYYWRADRGCYVRAKHKTKPATIAFYGAIWPTL